MKNKLCSAIAILHLLLFASNAAAQQEERFHQTLEVGPGAALSISNIAGDIQVDGSDGSSIVIDAVKSVEDEDDADLLDTVEVEVSQLGNRVRVSTEHTGRGGRRHGHGHGAVIVSYKVTVPRGTEVEIQSVSGGVHLAGVNGAANAQSVSGDVQVGDVSELVQAKSVSGSVLVQQARSSRRAEIESVSGDVEVRGIEASDLTVSSVSGDVRLLDVSSGRASLESVSGDLEYTGSIAASGRYDFQSHSGDVVITIGDQVGFELEASTFSGEIESDFTMSVSSRQHKGRSVEAVVGDGSAVIKASTFSGDIQLIRR
jgi:DUF4097 and DUF4098 domain-containing protein YvlB